MSEDKNKAYEAEKRILDFVEEVNTKGPYKPNWESLSEAVIPDWFRDEKFGIFMHWGLYSVAANSNEWYSRNMYIQGMPAFEHHVKAHGPQSSFGYKDFIPGLTAENFNPDELVQLYKDAGAGYIFPVAEHHDGFQMYGSELSKWNAVNMGPKRDILGGWKNAAEKIGLKLCCSSHRAEHWWFMSHGREFDSDVKEPMEKGDFYWPAMPEPDAEDLFSKPYPSDEYLNDWLARCAEIIIKYQPKLLYFDWWIQHQAFKPYLLKLAAFYYNMGKSWGEDVMICYKHDAMAFGSGIVEVERGGFAEAKSYYWQTDTAVAHNSWCYTDSLDYKDSLMILRQLIDVVSKNGNLLLNVGPRADGTLPDGDLKILNDLAAWMKVNREAIKGTKVWRKSMEGPTRNKEGQFQDGVSLNYTSEDFRFTCRGGNIYAICMRCPENDELLIKSLANSSDQNVPEFHGIIASVEILGLAEMQGDDSLFYFADKEGLHITANGISKLPEYYGMPDGSPIVVKITVE